MSPQASSRIELPVSRRMWLTRVFLVLALDLGLVAGGIAFILAWRARRTVEETPAVARVVPTGDGTVEPPAPPSNVELPKPRVLGRRKEAPRRTPVANPTPTPTPTPVPVPTPTPVPVPAVVDAGRAAAPTVDAAPVVVPPGIDAAPLPGVDAAPVAPLPNPEDEARAERILDVIREHVEEGRPQIDRCYERAAKATTQADPLRGRIEIEFTIQPSGDASGVRVVQNDTGSDDLGACLAGLLRSWKYPSPGDESIEFLWPFVFRGR